MTCGICKKKFYIVSCTFDANSITNVFIIEYFFAIVNTYQLNNYYLFCENIYISQLVFSV